MIAFTNPFQKVWETKHGDPVVGGVKKQTLSADGKLRTSKAEPMFSERTGELNTDSKREAMQQIYALMKQVQRGDIQEHIRLDAETREAIVNQMRLAATDRTGQEFVRLGEMFGDAIWTYGARQGIARNVLLIKEPKVQEDAKIKVYRKQTSVYMATGPSSVTPSFCELDYIYPPEYELKGLVLFPMHQLAISGPEFMDEKLADGLESQMVAEDRVLRSLAVASSSLENTPIGFNSLNPATFVGLYRQPRNFGLNVVACYIANDIWPELMTNSDFIGWWDQATMHELILEGQLGKMLGCSLFTDGFRDLRLQVLLPGEIFFFADPAHLGGLVQREPVQAFETNRFATGESLRGWFIRQSQGQALGNPRGVSFGYRV